MAALLKTFTGAREVLPQRTGLLLRFGERSTEQGSAKPARFAHLDYTTEWAHTFVDLVTTWKQATIAPYRRFAIYQTWRATSQPPGNTFVSRVCKHNDAHGWYYFSNLTSDEVLVFKAFDSEAPDANNAAHTAFDDPTAPPDATPRASVEARFVAFFR